MSESPICNECGFPSLTKLCASCRMDLETPRDKNSGLSEPLKKDSDYLDEDY